MGNSSSSSTEVANAFIALFCLLAVVLALYGIIHRLRKWKLGNHQHCSMLHPSADHVSLLWSQCQGQTSPVPEQSCHLYTLIAVQQYLPFLRRHYRTGNWLSSRCLTSSVIRELVFPSWHQILTVRHIMLGKVYSLTRNLNFFQTPTLKGIVGLSLI